MSLDILQLTDLHLFRTAQEELKGVRTQAAFRNMWDFVTTQIKSESWNVEWIVFSGDLAHDEQRDTYSWLRDVLGTWSPRCRFIPGNHDDRETIRAVFPTGLIDQSDFINFMCPAESWRLIGLDSQLTGKQAGVVSDQQLDWLDEELTGRPDQPTIIFIHHPPFSVDSSWLDSIGLNNREELLKVVRRHPAVRVISSGHVHQEIHTEDGPLTLLSTPSTSLQFLPHTDSFSLDSAAPGLRLFRLHDNEFETRVLRLPTS